MAHPPEDASDILHGLVATANRATGNPTTLERDGIDEPTPLLDALRAVNAASPFNGLAGFVITDVEPGAATLAIPTAPQLLNHAGALHAGVQSALIDTACGFAAASVAGNVVTVQMSVQFVASARGERFEARARVVRAAKSQVFAEAQLFAYLGDEERLAATGTAVLARV